MSLKPKCRQPSKPRYELPKPQPRGDTEVITGLVRDIRNNSQFRLWNCPLQQWYRVRNEDDAVLIQSALDNNYKLAVTIRGGKIVEGIELI
jgi:hypothetical protein